MKSVIRRSASMISSGEDANMSYCPPAFERVRAPLALTLGVAVWYARV
jgi:hypothetical protein